jgi:hypothetical protein
MSSDAFSSPEDEDDGSWLEIVPFVAMAITVIATVITVALT